jgi:nicotinamide-nucleotide amidase
MLPRCLILCLIFLAAAMFTDPLKYRANELLDLCRQKKLKIAIAESCTGGLLAALFTEIPGSSDVFERGFVTYSNESKNEMLGVDAGLIKKHGAVSEQVAIAMVQGTLAKSHADISIAVTGIAGPGGGTGKKPVGLVYIAVAIGKEVQTKQYNFKGDRNAIRLSAVEHALMQLKEILKLSSYAA